MAHQALYRKYRPADFESVVGQESVTSTLSWQVENGKTSHAYLFCGSRGTGKTSCAKILAKAVNCLAPVSGSPCGKCEACRAIDEETATDVLEMDAASNTGVDYIRDIRDTVVYAPAMLKNRVYIIDEVHMLSVSAFNALLKTLEEPPEQVIFILATTEPAKVPATILSRCQRYDFRRIPSAVIAKRLAFIAQREGLSFTEDALSCIARLAEGGMRDAISMLELCAGSGRTVTDRDVLDTVGVSGRETFAKVVTAVLDRDYDTVFDTVHSLYTSSRDIGVFLSGLISYYRDLLVCRATRTPEKYLEVSEGEMNALRTLSLRFSREKLVYHTRVLDQAFIAVSRGGADKRLLCETALLRLCDERLDDRTPALLSRIAALEAALASGIVPQRTPEPVPEVPAPAEMEEGPAPDPAPKEEKKEERRPIPDFIEAVNQVKQTDPTAASIMAMAKAYLLPDGRVLLRVTNDFYRTMLSRESAKAELLAALSALESLQGIRLTSVTAETAPQEEEEPADMDFVN